MTDEDQSDVYQATREFLTEHDDGRAVLETVLAAADEGETWEFDDVGLDSGTFGEVVSTGVVEKKDGEYCVANREAVRAVLDGEELSGQDDQFALDFDFDVNYSRLGGLFGALLVVIVARTFHYQSVFVDGRVVSPANDPYFFRYWQEQLAAQSSGPFSFGVLVNPPWDDGSFNQRPLTHAINWWFTELLGGDQWAADMVAAWLPLVFTVLLAIVIYYLALVLTRDYRVGIASVLVLALAPVHANYTGLGLLHHRYNQYLWFGLLLLTLAWLGADITRRRDRVEMDQAVREYLRAPKTWAIASVFGLTFAAWTHSWGGSLELFAALGAFVGFRVCLDVRDDVDPGLVNLPVVAGFGLGGILAIAIHLGLGWHGLLAPALAAVTALGVVTAVGLGALWHRRGWSARSLLVVQPVLAGIGVVVLVVSLGELSTVLDIVVQNLGAQSARGWQVSTQGNSLYATEQFVIFGPIVQIGLTFYFGVAMLGWCVAYLYQSYHPGWLLIGVVTAHYLVVSGVMVRFAGRLVIVMAPLAGLGIVRFLSVLELVKEPSLFADEDPSRPTRTASTETADSLDIRRAGLVLAVCIVIFGASLVFVPTLMGQLVHDESHVETATVIADHAETEEREYPDNHVLAPWSEYRMYNYLVSGESESESLGRYGYVPLFADREIDDRLERYSDRIGYLVLSGATVDVPSSPNQERLSDHVGIEDDRFEQLHQYRVMRIDEDADIVVFTVVEGADIEIETTRATVMAETNVSVSGRTFTYRHEVTVGDDNSATVTVPYPGTYTIHGETVTVTEGDVENGRTISVN